MCISKTVFLWRPWRRLAASDWSGWSGSQPASQIAMGCQNFDLANFATQEHFANSSDWI
jgi:hypothetical protein